VFFPGKELLLEPLAIERRVPWGGIDQPLTQKVDLTGRQRGSLRRHSHVWIIGGDSLNQWMLGTVLQWQQRTRVPT
jgi:hypothetical protein